MKTVGIISEYNPFHKGHLRQIEAIRRQFDEEVCIVALMSGNYVERGELAIYPKYYRAETAIRAGIDLVLELPYPWSGSCAETFALGGVSLATSLGLDYLCFGSETGDLSALVTEKERLQSDVFKDALDRAVKADAKTPYAILRERVYRDLYQESCSKRPNDILATTYLMAIDCLKSPIKPLVIKREGGESATASREAIRCENLDELKNLVPQCSYETATKLKPVKTEALERAFLKDWILMEKEDTEGVFELTEDLYYRIRTAAENTYSYKELLGNVASASYTNARIRRVLLSTIFGVTREMLFEKPAFTVLLGLGKWGRTFLKRVEFPILMRMSGVEDYGEEVARQAKIADRADRIYRLADENPWRHKPFVE